MENIWRESTGERMTGQQQSDRVRCIMKFKWLTNIEMDKIVQDLQTENNIGCIEINVVFFSNTETDFPIKTKTIYM